MKLELLLKMQKKIELIYCMEREIENAKAEIQNDYEILRRDTSKTYEFSYRFQEIIHSFCGVHLHI